MSNILSDEQEENIHGFTGDMKDYLRNGDFKSAMIMIEDLKKYVLEIQRVRKDKGKGGS